MTDNRLLVSVGDSPTREVVGREIDGNAIPLQDPNVVLPHLAAHVGQDFVSIFEFYAERRVWQDFGDGPHHLDGVTSHVYAPSYAPWIHGGIARRLHAPRDVRRMPAARRARQTDPLRDVQLAGLESPAARRALNCPGSTRRAHQRLVRPVCRDERQRLGRPVLLDAPSAHGHSPLVGNLYYPGRTALPQGVGQGEFLTPPRGSCTLPPP